MSNASFGRIAARAYTLVEMVASMAIMSILMGAIASALVVSARAIPASDTPLEQTAEAARIVQQIANELTVAIEFKTRTSKTVTFTIADRTNDADPETITYSWAGSDGDPLLRKFNNEADETLLDAVSLFDMTFVQRDTGETLESTEVGAETQLASHLTPVLEDRANVNSNRYLAQCFRPPLPGDAVAWSITRVQLMIHRSAGDGIGGSGAIQIRTADESLLPTATIVDQVTFWETNLSGSAQWEEFVFTDAVDLNPADDMCIVVTGNIADNVARWTEDDLSLYSGLRSRSLDQGDSWLARPIEDGLFSVFGTVTTPGGSSTVYELTRARIRLQPSGDAAVVETSTEVLNMPEIIQ